ncbi:hypothetical protein Ndes2526B_g05097 [Nannochloris sp. 'desiccata']|nr:hypothetical protein KSW81_000030 [Chlorella desiccata (nom. nud.)]KAH7619848.1 hypothetical protein NADE_008128 [Chlorella desiccata (nom. nud.)]
MAPVADRIFHHNNGVGSAKAEMRFLVHSVVPRPMKDPSRSHKGPRTEDLAAWALPLHGVEDYSQVQEMWQVVSEKAFSRAYISLDIPLIMPASAGDCTYKQAAAVIYDNVMNTLEPAINSAVVQAGIKPTRVAALLGRHENDNALAVLVIILNLKDDTGVDCLFRSPHDAQILAEECLRNAPTHEWTKFGVYHSFKNNTAYRRSAKQPLPGFLGNITGLRHSGDKPSADALTRPFPADDKIVLKPENFKRYMISWCLSNESSLAALNKRCIEAKGTSIDAMDLLLKGDLARRERLIFKTGVWPQLFTDLNRILKLVDPSGVLTSWEAKMEEWHHAGPVLVVKTNAGTCPVCDHANPLAKHDQGFMFEVCLTSGTVYTACTHPKTPGAQYCVAFNLSTKDLAVDRNLSKDWDFFLKAFPPETYGSKHRLDVNYKFNKQPVHVFDFAEGFCWNSRERVFCNSGTGSTCTPPSKADTRSRGSHDHSQPSSSFKRSRPNSLEA